MKENNILERTRKRPWPILMYYPGIACEDRGNLLFGAGTSRIKSRCGTHLSVTFSIMYPEDGGRMLFRNMAVTDQILA
jgi:hypothetical protein